VTLFAREIVERSAHRQETLPQYSLLVGSCSVNFQAVLDGQQMLTQSKNNLSRVTQQLSKLEKRDWELWVIISVTGILVSTTLLAILFHAAFLRDDGIHFELTVSPPLATGLFVMLGLLNTYLVSKRFEVRRLREQLISTTLQNQVIEQQSFIDPLTEIYNRHFRIKSQADLSAKRCEDRSISFIHEHAQLKMGKQGRWASRWNTMRSEFCVAYTIQAAVLTLQPACAMP
jgi:replication initiation and membrane attachment protein DnaB